MSKHCRPTSSRSDPTHSTDAQVVLESEDSLDFDHVQHVEAISTWKGQGPAQLPGAITARVECGRLTMPRIREIWVT